MSPNVPPNIGSATRVAPVSPGEASPDATAESPGARRSEPGHATSPQSKPLEQRSVSADASPPRVVPDGRPANGQLLLQQAMKWGADKFIDSETRFAVNLTSRAQYGLRSDYETNPIFKAAFKAQADLRNLKEALLKAPPADRARLAGLVEICEQEVEVAVNRASFCLGRIRRDKEAIQYLLGQALSNLHLAPSYLHLLSSKLTDCGQFESAIQCVELSIKAERRLPKVYECHVMAENWLKAGRPDRAFKLVQEARRASPDNDSLVHQTNDVLADALNQMGRYREAIRILETISSPGAQTHKALAIAYQGMNRSEDCEEALKSIDEPLVKAQAYLGMHRLPEALKCIDLWLQQDATTAGPEDGGFSALQGLLLSPEVLRSPMGEALRESPTWQKLVDVSQAVTPDYADLALGDYSFDLTELEQQLTKSQSPATTAAPVPSDPDERIYG